MDTHNSRIGGSENPHEYVEHVRDSPKLDVLCTLNLVYTCPFLLSGTLLELFTLLSRRITKIGKKEACCVGKSALLSLSCLRSQVSQHTIYKFVGSPSGSDIMASLILRLSTAVLFRVGICYRLIFFF